MADTIFGVLKKDLQRNIEDVTEAIVSNSVSDYAEYMHLRGVVRGLRTSLVIVETMEKNLLKEENDDD